MWYVIVGQDVDNSLPLRKEHRPAHAARLHELDAAGRLLVAGPCPAVDAEDPGDAGFTGSVIVAAFDSLADAQAWADADPYVVNGVHDQITVTPFRKVFPT